jgi:hypothetical protein
VVAAGLEVPNSSAASELAVPGLEPLIADAAMLRSILLIEPVPRLILSLTVPIKLLGLAER